jgi:hypothetical protein
MDGEKEKGEEGGKDAKPSKVAAVVPQTSMPQSAVYKSIFLKNSSASRPTNTTQDYMIRGVSKR